MVERASCSATPRSVRISLRPASCCAWQTLKALIGSVTRDTVRHTPLSASASVSEGSTPCCRLRSKYSTLSACWPAKMGIGNTPTITVGTGTFSMLRAPPSPAGDAALLGPPLGRSPKHSCSLSDTSCSKRRPAALLSRSQCRRLLTRSKASAGSFPLLLGSIFR